MIDTQSPRITPWVGRLLAINAVVLLLQQTVFTSSYIEQLIEFNANTVAQRPWTVLTYMFVHAGVLHLAANSIALFTFGPPVERRLGSSAFLVYYLYCGIMAAGATWVLASVHIGGAEVIGASGAIMGVAYAFAKMFPDTPLLMLFVPAPIRAKWAVGLFVGFDVFGLFFLNDGIAHGTHLGGVVAGAFYFVLRSIARPSDVVPLPTMRPRVPVAARGGGTTIGGHRSAVAPRKEASLPQPSTEQQHAATETAEMDRVLDKISATGISSLTADERLFLDSVARRRRDLPH
ncbi:MAG TPA: rhomboid family intramembrane serine protease [Gemmatimonadales bacterium]|jgi:membrane associated rhomboid family serine protease